MTDTNGLSELCGRLADVATTLEAQDHPGAADVRAAISALRRDSIAAEARDLHAEAMAERGTASAFKVGDRVRIARRFKTTTSGWAWSPRMDDTLGKCGILDHLVEDVFHVCFEDDQAGWCYAAEALDRLDRNPTRIRMMDTPDGED